MNRFHASKKGRLNWLPEEDLRVATLHLLNSLDVRRPGSLVRGGRLPPMKPGMVRTVRREVSNRTPNVAKKAAYQFGKVLGRRTTAVLKSKKASFTSSSSMAGKLRDEWEGYIRAYIHA